MLYLDLVASAIRAWGQQNKPLFQLLNPLFLIGLLPTFPYEVEILP